MPRQPVQYDPPGQGGLRPVASPVASPYVPSIPKPTLIPVQELAGLSEALANVSLQQAERANQRAKQEGMDAAAAAPMDLVEEIGRAGADLDDKEAKLKANADAFAKAQAGGKIHVSQNPHHRQGWIEVSAHRLMTSYDAQLQQALSAVTATVDAQGNPVIAQDPAQVVQDAWAKFAGNSILTDFHGSKVAQARKQDIDERFQVTAARRLAEAQQKAMGEWGQNTLAEKFHAMASLGHDPGDEEAKEVRDFVTELRRRGVTDTGAVTLNAMEGAASQADADDDGAGGVSKAANLLRDLLQMPYGTTTVEKDADAGTKVQALIRRYDAMHEEKAKSKATADEAEKRLAFTAADREALALFQSEEQDGNGDVLGVAAKYVQDIQNDGRFGPNTPLVVQHVQQLALAQKEQVSGVHAENLVAEMVGGADPTLALQTARTMMARGGMNLEQYKRVAAVYQEQVAVRPLLEGSATSASVMASLARAADMPGVPADVGALERAANEEALEGYRSRAAAAAKQALAMAPEARDEFMRTWTEENRALLEKDLRAKRVQFSTARDQALAEADDLLNHASSPEQVLQSKGQYFSQEEREKRRARAAIATDRTRFMGLSAYTDAEAFVVGSLTDKYKDTNAGQLRDIVEAARRELRDQFLPALDSTLPTVDPSAQTGAAQKVLDEITPKVLERMAASNVVRIAESAKPGGEGVTATLGALKTAEDDLGVADTLAGKSAEDVAAQLTSAATAGVSEDHRALQKAYLGGERQGPFGWFGAPTRANIEDRAYTEVVAALSDRTLTDQQAAQAAVDAHKVTGIAAQDVLDGKLRVRASDEFTAKLRAAQIRTERGRFGALGVNQPFADALESELTRPPVEVDISKAKLNAYTTPFFKSEAELQEFGRTRNEDIHALARKLGVPDGDTEFKKWLAFQKDAIRRATTNAQ